MNRLSFHGRFALLMVCIAGLSFGVSAQEPPTLPTLRPPPPELFPEDAQPDNTERVANLWDGVDRDNNLRVFVNRLPVLDDVGRMRTTQFPPSPNFVDINNSGLKDLVVGDGYGFVWIFLNSGEKGKPKFTTGQFLHTFVGWGSRVHVADWNQNGLYDLIIGTYYGDICIFENTGTREQYRFNRGMAVPRYIDPRDDVDDPRVALPQVRLGKEPMIIGIYMAPWVVDWNDNQRPDLIFGEGTYSANSVRIAFNRGPRGRPTFVEESLFFLAYGEGAEQLTPAVVDYNGDGINDLIMGTRTGELRLYKGTEESVDPSDLVAALRSTLAPAALEFDGILQIEGKDVWDTMTYVHPCDWNENGLFDLLLGSTSGRIYIALNEGTKTKPYFPKAVPIKGTDVRKDLLGPSQWSAPLTWSPAPGSTATYSHLRARGGVCNAALLLSSEKEVMLTPGAPPIKATAGERFMHFRYVDDYLGLTRREGKPVTGGRSIMLRGSRLRLEFGKRYQFSFDSILTGRQATWDMRAQELVRPGTDTRAPGYEWLRISDTVRPSGGWQRRTYTFVCPTPDYERGFQRTNALNFELRFSLPEGDSELMLDNFSLQEVRR